jgi:hypothetical protein
MKFFAIGYFFWLGWMARKTGIDEKIFRKIEITFDALAARAGEEFGAAFRETAGIAPIPLPPPPGRPVTDVNLPPGM